MTTQIIQQPIAHVVIADGEFGMEGYTVGNDGVTKIEIVWRPRRPTWWGFWRPVRPMIFLPFVVAWRGEEAIGEWSQHRIRGVYFAVDQAEIDALIASDPTDLLARVAAAAAAQDGQAHQ